MFQDIKLWTEPVRQLSNMDLKCEMDIHDHSFLCGMIKDKKPGKVLEIGVAEGGTTAIIVNSLSILGKRCEVYSVDLSRTLYCDEGKMTGYEYNRVLPYISTTDIDHNFLLGKTVASQIDKIGGGIDFVIIDTTHKLPGEIMEFLCVLPYLNRDAVVVLHDTNLNYLRAAYGNRSWIISSKESVATKLLFSSVKGNKYLPITQEGLPNITAFTVSDDTYSYIEDVFYSLTFTWTYMPGADMLNEYRNIFKRHYSKECLKLYDIAILNNQRILNRMQLAETIMEENISKYRFPYHVVPNGSRIVLYGAGAAGREVYDAQIKRDIYKIVLWVDKNYEDYADQGFNVEAPDNMSKSEFDFIIVAVESDTMFQDIKQDIVVNGWDAGRPILGPISKY